MKYVYTFTVWPDETCDFRRAIFDWFKLARRTVEMNLTEEEFKIFRTDMLHDGFTLRGLTRRPYVEPEVIF